MENVKKMYFCKIRFILQFYNPPMSVIIISLVFAIPIFAGMVYFMYRYHLGKKNSEKKTSYDFTGMLFLIFVNIGGVTGMIGNCLKNIIANDNARMLVSLAISVALVAVADIIVRIVVRKKMQNSESE